MALSFFATYKIYHLKFKNMMKKALIVTFLFVSSIAAMAAPEEVSLKGKVKGTDGKTLRDVTVTVAIGEQTFVGKTDKEGRYEFQINKSDSATVGFSHVGYETKVMRIALDGRDRQDVVLYTKAIGLGEVEVTSSSVIAKAGSVTYIPNRNQVNSSNSGLGLLANIMIPQIDVNRFTGEVKGTDGSAVGIYIDGRKTNLAEVNSLRPRDIKTVEYYEGATDKFPNEQKVINFRLRKYNSGGYVDVRTDTRFFYASGDYQAQASIDSKKFNYTVMAGTSLSRDRGVGTETDEGYKIRQGFEKTTTPIKGISENINSYGLFRSTYKSGMTMAFAQASLNFNKTPKSRYRSFASYTPEVLPSEDVTTSTWSKSVNPSVNTFFSTQTKHNEYIYGSFDFSYGRNEYRRSYIEGQMDEIRNNVKEDAYNFDAKLNYTKAFKKNNSLGLLLWGNYDKSNTNYLDGNNEKQTLNDWIALFYPTYSQRFGNKLAMNIQAGIAVNSYGVSGYKRTTDVLPRPRLTMNYTLGKKSSVYVDAAWGSTTPQISTLSSVRQRISPYEVLQGNPLLKNNDLIQATGAYNFYVDKFRMSAVVSYNGLINLRRNDYYAEGNDLVRTFVNDGNYHSVDAGVNAMLFLLGRSLQLKTTVLFKHQSYDGKFADSYNSVFCGVNASYFLKEFSFNAYFRTPQKTLMDVPAFMKMRADYGLPASWGHKGFFAEVGARRLFDTKKFSRYYFDYDVYRINSRTISDSMGRQVYIKLSYNFDFGRKIQKNEINMNSNINSGILKP